jgi:phenylacetate-coenzyme A ligase PaaK-like adenylate-forming protein
VPEGTPGELVFTTPTKEALPLLRYRTGDIASLSSDPCPCGRTLVRMSKVLGRVDDMMVIRGVNVYPSEVERVLLGFEHIGPHYQLVIDRRQALARLVVACESTTAPGPAGVRAEAVGHELYERLGLHADVRVLPAGTVPRVEVGKAVRVVTWKSGESPIPGLE